MRLAVPHLPAQRYPAFVESYRRHFLARKDAMLLFDGMRGLLAELSGKHLLAIATGKSRRGLDHDLDFHGLKALFAASRCADETKPKPHPAMLQELMAELEVPEHETIMIAVTYGAHPEAGLRACEPLLCIADVASLRTWLNANA